MSDRPTPETDNITRGNHVVPTEWAQQLERERDEAREEIKEWKTLCLWGGTPEHIHGFIGGQQTRIWHLECERDEARELLASEKITRNHIIKRSVEVERERDEAREDLNNIRINLGEDADGFTLLHAVCALQNERDDARAVADELSAIAARYLGWHLSRTPMGPDDDHLAQSRRISETLARWKSLASA